MDIKLRTGYRFIRAFPKSGGDFVCLAWRTTPDGQQRRVVFKMGEPGSTERVEMEIAALNKLDYHPNLAHIEDWGMCNHGSGIAVPFVVTTYLGPCSLNDLRRANGGTLDSALVAHIGRMVAKALAHIHKHGIIHRDLKPANIMIGVHGDVVVIDLGIAKDALVKIKKTRTGVVKGTPAYLSPEQIRLEGKPDGGIDLWALGVILYELRTGESPFEFDDDDEFASASNEAASEDLLRARIMSGRVPSLPDVDPLKPIVKRLLQKIRSSRYADAEELIAELRPIAMDSEDAGNKLKELAALAAQRSAGLEDEPVEETENNAVAINTTAQLPLRPVTYDDRQDGDSDESSSSISVRRPATRVPPVARTSPADAPTIIVHEEKRTISRSELRKILAEVQGTPSIQGTSPSKEPETPRRRRLVDERHQITATTDLPSNRRWQWAALAAAAVLAVFSGAWLWRSTRAEARITAVHEEATPSHATTPLLPAAAPTAPPAAAPSSAKASTAPSETIVRETEQTAQPSNDTRPQKAERRTRRERTARAVAADAAVAPPKKWAEDNDLVENPFDL
jgi:serine/threonine protein kinase